MTIRNILGLLAAAVLIALISLAVGCNKAAQSSSDDNSSSAAPPTTSLASESPADAGAKPAGEAGGCACCAEGASKAAAPDGEAKPMEGGCCEDGGATETTGVTMANAGGEAGAKASGEACEGECGEGGECAGDCEEGGTNPAGGCATCPGTAKTLTAMAGDEKCVLKVDGMTCTDCENAIRATLANVKGVKLGVADHKQGRAWVAYDPKVANVQVISAAISRLGYTVDGEVEHVSALPALKNGHERAAIYIDKVSCADCTKRINDAIRAMPGVDTSAVDRQYKIVFVDFDPAQEQPAAFKDKILEIGYSAALPGENMADPKEAHCDGCTGEASEKTPAADAA